MPVGLAVEDVNIPVTCTYTKLQSEISAIAKTAGEEKRASEAGEAGEVEEMAPPVPLASLLSNPPAPPDL